MEPQTPPLPPPPPPGPPPGEYLEEDILFFLASCAEALIAHAVKRGMKATQDKMLDGLAKDRITYRQNFPGLTNIEMEQKLLRITARRMRWEPLMPREEHPEMHDPFFHPYGLNLIYANELHPDAQRMLYECPPIWSQEQQQEGFLMEQDHGYLAAHYEDEPRRSKHFKAHSPSSWKQTRKNKKRLPEGKGSPPAPKRRKIPGDGSHSPTSRNRKEVDGTVKEAPPRYGYDDKERPYYSIFLDGIKETYGIFIGKRGMCIKPVEEHFSILNFRVHKYEDIDRVVIWAEEMKVLDEKITPRTREKLVRAWTFLQAWADEVDGARKQRAENDNRTVKPPTIARYLDKWKVFEETEQWPNVSKKIREPTNRLEQGDEY